MVAGTKRGLFLFGLHTFSVFTLVALFTSFFVEFYIHECLLIVKVKDDKSGSEKSGDVKVSISKWGLSFFLIAQVVYAAVAALHQFGLLHSFSFGAANRQAFGFLRCLSGEHRFVLLFCLSWSLLRFPLLPSAVTFTLLFASLSALSTSCAAFAAQAAREMAQQRPKEGEWISLAARLAAAGTAVVVFAAAVLYDGTRPRSGLLGGFYGLVWFVSGGLFAVFTGLQYLRRRGHSEESGFAAAAGGAAAFAAREDAGEGSPLSPRIVAPLYSSASSDGAFSAEFHAFARQTCQRRSMKALLAVRGMHTYAHTVVLYFFHLILTLGGGMQLSVGARAFVLAAVTASAFLCAPLTAGLCSLLGKKRSLTLTCALMAAAGGTSLLMAYFTRDARAERVRAPAAGTLITKEKGKSFLAEVSTAGTAWCVGVLVLQRVLLDIARDLLDVAQEDVVEEDAILFGRPSSMAVWTRRLAAVSSIPAQSLSFMVSIVFLAASGAFRVMWTAPGLRTVPSTPALAQSGNNTSTVASALTGSSPSELPTWFVVANGSTMLAFLGLQTCGVTFVMCVVWQRFYNLDGKHLQFVQMATRKRKEEQTIALV